MLSKEESLKKAKELSYGWHVGDNEFVPLKDINKLIREIYSIKPYKWEDLKPGMWVWDSKIEKCNKILEINNDKIGFYYLTGEVTRFTCLFEENRFFPVQMANVRCE